MVNRGYHNLTAHYNVYFNGNESLKAGLLKIDKQVEEDYTKILPIFKESLPNTEKIVSSDMSTAIEKGIKTVKFHSITKPPKAKKSGRRSKNEIKPEYNHWIDDAYMMMGRAYLYKKDYIMAISTFQLIIRKYKNEPVRYDAYIWLIRGYSESERYTEASQLIQTLENDKQFPKKLEGELAIVNADLQMKQQLYDEAIHYLNIGIKKIQGNKRKSRYTFILAQLYQETGKKDQALEAYHQVIRRRPEYPLLFNARIKSAEVLSGEGNVSDLRKELNKMSRKKWNQPYLDQIYYALGNISYNEGKVDDAIGLYAKSVAVSKNNIHQKALSSLTLGDIYFDQKKYISSSNYYDSAMVIIDDKYPNYETISKKYNSLTNLVNNLKCVETEDSLQHLASLPKAELDKLVLKWIAAEKARQEELMKSESENSESASAYYNANSSRMRLNTSSSSFYFYNTSTISYGKKEFAKLWGDRKNEDDWRRKNKNAVSVDEAGETAESDSTTILAEEKQRADDPTKPEYYTQDIPINDSMKQASHIKIRDALFNSGTILKNDFNDYNHSVVCFTDLDKRYPDNIYLLTSWFNLWDLYKSLENPDSSDYYKNLIIKNYPASNYSKYLLNPNFFTEEAARRDSINKLYNLAFSAFKLNDFSTAGTLSGKVIAMNPDTAIISKAQFIRTIANSRTLNKEIFGDSLKDYIVRYPKSQTTKLAEKILSFIRQDKFTNYEQMVASGYLNDVIKNNELLTQNVKTGPEEVGKWDTDNELLHYFIIAFPVQNQVDINRLKFDLANYNLDHFTTFDFEIETENLNQETTLVIVRNFENKESAMVYFMSIIRNPDVFKSLSGKPYINFVASNNNYRQMLNDRKYDDYITYFVKNYSNQTSGKFSDKELESPEALMARLKEDPNNDLKEQGEFVMVNTADPNYTPVKKEQLFISDYNLSHSVTLLISQKNAGTGFMMRDLFKYNTASYRDKRLRVVPGRMNDYTLLSVSSFPNAYEANEYLKILRDKKEIFASLGELKYETFIISDENLKKLIETGKIDEWNKFYQLNYVRKVPQAPKPVEVKPTETKQEGAKTEVAKLTDSNKEEAKAEEKKPAEQKNEIIIEPSSNKVAEPNIPVQKNNPIKKDSVQNQQSTVTTGDNASPDETTAPVIAESPKQTEAIKAISDSTEKVPETEGIYNAVPETGHNLIYLLPVKSPNQNLLTAYLNRLNAVKFRSDGLSITTEPFNDKLVLVIVKGLSNKDKATAYFTETKNDQRIVMSLKNVSYQVYLISNDNLQKLKTTKDIAAYQQFSDKNY